MSDHRVQRGPGTRNSAAPARWVLSETPFGGDGMTTLGAVTNIDAALAGAHPEPVTSISTATPRKCRRHEWWSHSVSGATGCLRCHKVKDEARSRRSRNNGKRGRAAELDVARSVGGRKVGPLGHPWDVEMVGYARLQVKKLVTPPSLRTIAGWLADIARTPGEEMPGVVWVEPGRGGERLVVFRAKDFAERHGTPTGDEG